MKPLLYLSLSALCVSAVSMALAQDKKLDSDIRFYGRWDLRDHTRAVTVNSGSHLVARFKGTGATAHFDTSLNRVPFPTLAWQIDGGEWEEGELSRTVALASGLKQGTHTLMLMIRDLDEHQSRWSPPLTASATFTGLDIAGGKLTSPPPAPKLKIEFLGDSITEGVLVHPPRPGKETWTWRADGRLSYASQTAMRLGAQWRQVGFGRLGVLIEGNGGVPPAAESFNWFYKGCPRDGWEPDIVSINQGTNDGGRSSAEFRPAYAQYLKVIRKAYPKALILALRPFGGYHADDIKAEVEARSADKNIRYVDTSGWLERADYTDGVHPNAQGDTKAAEKLADQIRTLAPPHK